MNTDPVFDPVADDANVGNNKLFAIIGYILFFVPLLAARESKFAMYHANQALTLFLCAVAINIVGSIIPFLGWFIITPIGNLIVFILAIVGIVNAANAKTKPLPVIGGVTLLKL